MAKILWADDEIELLLPHVLFLKNKGHEIITVQSGDEAVDKVKEEDFEMIFLDENMPGLSGLDTLELIKTENPSVPIIMITKSEEEEIMDEAIGGRISDYLIKPVNPNQILLAIKKNLEGKRLVNEKASSNYQQKFREISLDLQNRLDDNEWIDIYKRIVYWELQLDKSDQSMQDILQMQKNEANQIFSKYVEKNYLNWINIEGPLMSHQLLKDKVFPHAKKNKTFLIVIDNLRYDQWLIIRPLLREMFTIKEEELYYSILPTATQYARNSMFAGMLPSEIKRKFPSKWKDENDEGSKNQFEEDFLLYNLNEHGINVKTFYNKITNLAAGKKLLNNFNNLLQNDFNVIVYNFVDMLSHARTDMEVIRELADDESAYRSLTLSWFKHSALYEMFQLIAENNIDVMITTDHGTIKVNEPSKVIGDRNTNANLRYKQGRNLNYKAKDVLAIKNPDEAFLPKSNISSSYIFAKESKFFVYPNNYNYYVNYYKDTFQHGGISMEEVLIPFISLKAK
jgi:CheY-like chemotaxis protein